MQHTRIAKHKPIQPYSVTKVSVKKTSREALIFVISSLLRSRCMTSSYSKTSAFGHSTQKLYATLGDRFRKPAFLVPENAVYVWTEDKKPKRRKESPHSKISEYVRTGSSCIESNAPENYP